MTATEAILFKFISFAELAPTFAKLLLFLKINVSTIFIMCEMKPFLISKSEKCKDIKNNYYFCMMPSF